MLLAAKILRFAQDDNGALPSATTGPCSGTFCHSERSEESIEESINESEQYSIRLNLLGIFY
ncbi:MAG: hypothetical protein FWF86_08320, partial [Clostridia bacterium]|nr:hypothetical protein [Clostridia bacterium]